VINSRFGLVKPYRSMLPMLGVLSSQFAYGYCQNICHIIPPWWPCCHHLTTLYQNLFLNPRNSLWDWKKGVLYGIGRRSFYPSELEFSELCHSLSMAQHSFNILLGPTFLSENVFLGSDERLESHPSWQTWELNLKTYYIFIGNY